MAGLVRGVWQALVPRAARQGVHEAVHALRFAMHRRTTERRLQRSLADAVAPGGVLVSGFLSDVNGLGRAARLTTGAIEKWGVPVARHDIRTDPRGTESAARAMPGGIWLCHCNASDALYLFYHGDPQLWRGRYRIGHWVYELERLPPNWLPALRCFHEIWTPSAFVAKAIREAARGIDVPVRVVPYPSPEPGDVVADRRRFETEGQFVCLAMFDTLSTAARKNPFGAIRAFQSAFAATDAGVLLVVKVVNPGKDRTTIGTLLGLVSGWPNIRLVMEHLSDADTLALIASVDCMLALYRSEGFGLPVAEAMLLGAAVVATDWSAPPEFCAGGAMLVPYRLVPVEDPSGTYPQGALWAEPDLAAAAAAIRQLREAPAMRAQMVETARRLVRERLPATIATDGYERLLARPER